ncbi:hypothetical protein GW17_00052233 [Ensete ventricosum]|nr:hypothetical protein GW17_00052233 [Ensete ventricosum]
MRAAALAGCDSGMRQQGWQMTLSTKKGAALMMAAIDDGCCDWGDDKMVRLLMEEKVIGCSNMGEGGGSVQRRVVTRADREIASDWQWEGAVDDGKKGEMDKKTPDYRCFLQFIQVKIGGFLSTNLHDFLLASSILPERRHLKGLGHIGVGPIAIFSTFPATATFPLLTFFLYYFLLPTAALIAASDCSISAASPFCSSCPAFSVNLTGLRSSLAAVCGNLLAALIAGRASSLRSFAAPLPPSWQPHRSSVVARPKFPSVSTLKLCKATCYPSFSSRAAAALAGHNRGLLLQPTSDLGAFYQSALGSAQLAPPFPPQQDQPLPQPSLRASSLLAIKRQQVPIGLPIAMPLVRRSSVPLSTQAEEARAKRLFLSHRALVTSHSSAPSSWSSDLHKRLPLINGEKLFSKQICTFSSSSCNPLEATILTKQSQSLFPWFARRSSSVEITTISCSTPPVNYAEVLPLLLLASLATPVFLVWLPPGYIDGSLSCPPALVHVPGEPNPVPNSTYKLWLHQDRLILQAIQAFVIGSIAPLVSSCATAVEVWTKLQTTLASRSRTRMLGLLSNLMAFKQEGSTVADNLQHIKLMIDDLTLIYHSLSNEEVLIYMLNGLSSKFKELAASLRARDSPISFEELYNKLTDYETYLKHDAKLLGPLPGPPITAQFNQTSKRHNRKYNKNASKGVANFPTTSMSNHSSLPPPYPPHLNHHQSTSFSPCRPPPAFQ